MRDRGSATAELAILFPGVVLLLAWILTAGTAVVSQIRCIDAASTGARLAARGESAAAVLSAARAAAPGRASVNLRAGSTTATVSVRAPVHLAVPITALTVTASVTSVLESSLNGGS